MKTVEISYNPYKMITKMTINGIDVCEHSTYDKFKKFIEDKTPLQTWIEPIPYLKWGGFVNEITGLDGNEEVTLIFSGRKIDFQDLKHAIKDQNDERPTKMRVKYHYEHKKILDDKELSKNIEEVVKELESDRFRKLLEERPPEGLSEELNEKYNALEENYTIAKESEFYIVFAGTYSSGKSTLLNTLIRHDILPTDSDTCTSRNCRIRHDSTLGNKISLSCYDENEKVVIKKKIFDNDYDCANAFTEICPIGKKETADKYAHVETMELGVNLSHLYPESVNEDQFTIVLVDTPGVNSIETSENGKNKHAKIALKAISMESKPMIIFCVDATQRQAESIGMFMKKIIYSSKEKGIGFNDRFLFLMNKSDLITYKQNKSAEGAKKEFAEYLTDHSNWSIEVEDEELQQLADSASRFVPRVFMTAAAMAFAIQCNAYEFTDEERCDQETDALCEQFESFEKKICVRKNINFYLSRYCDIPNYRKDEIEKEFEEAVRNGDDIRATQLQCGIISVEYAIRDYIERYAYPIKVRGLLGTFENILEDVNNFTNSTLVTLKNAKKELGEKTSEREGEEGRKQCAEEKIAALETEEEKVKIHLAKLDNIQFDSEALRDAIGEFIADIEEDKEIVFIRQNPIVQTGQKSRSEVENEIDLKILHIQNLFDDTLSKTNNKLKEMQKKYDKQLLEIFEQLKLIVGQLEQSAVFEQGAFKFTDSYEWTLNFADIDSEGFVSDMKKKVVDRSQTSERVLNDKKIEWKISGNPFKKIGSIFMDDYKTVVKITDGFYETGEILKRISEYFQNLHSESSNMQEGFKEIMENSKKEVCDLTNKLLRALENFRKEIEAVEKRIKELAKSIDVLNNEIGKYEETCQWLSELKERIEGE